MVGHEDLGFLLPRAMRRNQGLPDGLLRDVRENLPRRYPKNDTDVFCYVNRYISDMDVSQRALVVFPGAVLPQVVAAWRRLSTAACSSCMTAGSSKCVSVVPGGAVSSLVVCM